MTESNKTNKREQTAFVRVVESIKDQSVRFVDHLLAIEKFKYDRLVVQAHINEAKVLLLKMEDTLSQLPAKETD